MITMFVKSEIVVKEYEKESQELINILRNSNSKYKDTDISKVHWLYSFSYFRKKGENTPEYYESLFKMPFEERLEVELKRVRVSLALSAGYFYVSDRVLTISDTIKETVKMITTQKMVNEQQMINDVNIINSIPFIQEDKKIEPMSLHEQLKHAVDAEDYEEAARLRDEIRKLEN